MGTRTMRTKATSEVSPSGRYRFTDAAQRMGISRSSIYNYIKDGRVKMGTIIKGGKVFNYIPGLEIIKYNNNKVFNT